MEEETFLDFGEVNCPNRQVTDWMSYECSLTNGHDADSRGWGNDPCEYSGDYRKCSIKLDKE